jgi:FkbM family methyltransferase
MRTLDPLTARARRTLEVARLDARPGLRRELLAMDYVLPLARLRSGCDPIRLRTRSKAASGSLYFGRESFPVDRVAYFGIFLEGWYGGDYDGAVVVDIGGHKGYYGAFALHAGASEVHSYEPESRNFAALERAAASFDGRWTAHRAAVGAEPGVVTLHVNAESAGHSIVFEQTEGRRPTLGSEQVLQVAMEDVLGDASGSGAPVIVKIDAEGAECHIVLGTDVAAWRGVEAVFLEIHDFAACSSADIIGHLEEAGLSVVLHERDDQSEADLVALRRHSAVQHSYPMG